MNYCSYPNLTRDKLVHNNNFIKSILTDVDDLKLAIITIKKNWKL